MTAATPSNARFMAALAPQTDGERRHTLGLARKLLIDAALEGRWKRVFELLDAGAPVARLRNTPEEDDRTVLHHLAEFGDLAEEADPEAAAKFLAHPRVRAAINARSASGDTALDLALATDSTWSDLLRAAGGTPSPESPRAARRY